jgi:hypothetical protein
MTSVRRVTGSSIDTQQRGQKRRLFQKERNMANIFGIDGISNMMLADVLDDSFKLNSMCHLLRPHWIRLAQHPSSGMPATFITEEMHWLSFDGNYMPIHKMLVRMKDFIGSETFKQMLLDIGAMESLLQYKEYEHDKEESLLLRCSQ